MSASEKNKNDIYCQYGNDIINHLDVGAVIVNAEGILLRTNNKAKEIFQQNGKLNHYPESIAQALDIKWVPDNSAGYHMSYFITPDNKRCILEYATKKLKNNKEPLYLVQIRDVTQRIQLDAELTTYRLQLEELVTQRSQSLIKARDRALQAIQEKNTFLANITHEFRTPLNAIIGYCELLRDDVKDNGHNDYLDDIHKIGLASQNLKSLVEDILDTQEYEINSPQLSISEINTYELIRNVAQSCGEVIQANQNTIALKIDPSIAAIKGDKVKIQRILHHLLHNAAKFTSNGNIIISTEELTVQNTSYVNITVSDTGIGISQEEMKTIFDKFTQADPSPTRAYNGAGLGLAVCKTLAHNMGGEITVTSKLDVGSCFKLKLPAAPINSRAQTAALESPAEF